MMAMELPPPPCLCCGEPCATTPATIAAFVAARTGMDPRTTSVICRACGFERCGARMTDEQAAALYRGYRGPEYNAEREAHEPGYTAAYAHLNNVRDYIGDVELMIRRSAGGHINRVLDIGGNDGANTPFLGIAAVDVMDVGGVVNVKGVRRVHRPDGQYDLAVLAHVLEHAADPEAMLRTAADCSRMVYLEVPAEPAGQTVWHEHINVFTLGALAALCKRVGLSAKDSQLRQTSLGPVLQVVAL